MMEQDIITGVRFTGAIDMLIAALCIAFVYRGKVQSKVYNRSRWFLVAAAMILCLHNFVQFFGHFREQSVCTCWVINLSLYSLTAGLLGMSEFNLLRAGNRMRSAALHVVITLVVLYILLIVGIITDTLINDAMPWFSTTGLMAAVYTIMLIMLNSMLSHDLWAIRAHLDQSDLKDKHQVLSYTAASMQVLMYVSMVTPWIGMSDSLLLNGAMGIVICVIMLWHMLEFIQYGRDMNEVIEVENEIYVGSMKEHSKPDNDRPDLVKTAIEEWVRQEHYVNPNITLGQVLGEINISPAALSYYLQSQLNIPNYRQWIPYLRIEHAKKLMKENPAYALENVADICGFSNGSAFSRAFKAQTGLTPSQWQAEEEQ